MATWSSIIALSKSLIGFSPSMFIVSLGLMLFRSLTSGIGLLLIVPLLGIMGFNLVDSQSTIWSQKVNYLFQTLHLTFNLEDILFIFIIAVGSIATMHYLEEVTRVRWQERYQYYLRKSVYSSLLQAHWDYFVQKKQSHLLHSLTAQLQAAWLCHYLWLQILSQGILIGVYLSIVLWVSWSMTCLVLLLASLLQLCIRPLHRHLASHNLLRLNQNRHLFQALYEQLSIFKIIKSSHKEDVFIEKILADSQEMKKQSLHFTKLHAVSKWSYQVGATLSFGVLLYVSIVILKLPKDSIVILMIAFARLMPKTEFLQQQYQHLLSQLPNYESLQQLLNESRLHQEMNTLDEQKKISFQQTITFENVDFFYNLAPSRLIIKNMSLKIKKNTTTLLIGPSGCGKTTVLDLLVGLLTPTRGRIAIDNQTLTLQHLAAWRESIAYITQDSILVNATIRENLQLFCEKKSDTVLWETLKNVSAHHWVTHLPLGLDTVIGDKGVMLSGGECQCIALGRAMLMQPQLLILDESTNALDDEKILFIQQFLKKSHRKLTIVIISHQWVMRDFADTVIHLPSLMAPDVESDKAIELSEHAKKHDLDMAIT